MPNDSCTILIYTTHTNFRADSLEEIVGLDISYHGGQQVQTESDNGSSYEEIERQYYEQREQQRQKQKSKLRRRLLMMDLSLSRGNSAVAADTGENENGGDVGTDGSTMNSEQRGNQNSSPPLSDMEDVENPGAGVSRQAIVSGEDEAERGTGDKGHAHSG